MKLKNYFLDLAFFVFVFLFLISIKLLVANFLVYAQGYNLDYNWENMSSSELDSANGEVNTFGYYLQGVYLAVMYLMPLILFGIFMLVQLLHIGKLNLRSFCLGLIVVVIFYLTEGLLFKSLGMILYNLTYFIYFILILGLLMLSLYLWYSSVIILKNHHYKKLKILYKKFYFSFIPFILTFVLLLLFDLYFIVRYLTSSFSSYEWIYEIIFCLGLIYLLSICRDYYIKRVEKSL